MSGPPALNVRPTALDDLPELGRFLVEGFHAPPGASFAATDVLRWKYFDPRGLDAGDAPRSLLAREPKLGAIVGHVGVCPARFRGGALPADGISTLHMIDWLSTGGGAGAALMRRAHRAADTQYGFGGSAAGRGVIDRGGYGLVALVPVVQRVLRPGHRLRDPSHGVLGRLARAARDVAGIAGRPPRRADKSVELRPVAAFGPEVNRVLQRSMPRALFTSRGPDFLNHVLRYPRGGVTGFLLDRDGATRGFAVLSIVARDGGSARQGRVAECLLDDPDDADLWLASAAALTAELKRQGADVAVAFASTPWSALAFRSAGYAVAHALEFRLRDRSGRLPVTLPFHLTPLEADYAYT